MFTWTPEMIRLMQNANARSEYHRQLAAILAPKLAGCRTLCDGAETAAKSSDEGSTFSDGTPPPSVPLSPPHDANSRHSAGINKNFFIE